MEADLVLSESERATLRNLAYGCDDSVLLDWLAVYRLKQRGLIEGSYTGPRLTTEGRRVIGLERISPKSKP